MAELKVSVGAELALGQILAAFEHPEDLPAKLAKTYLALNRYCSRWSKRNQLLVWLNGHSDGATDRTWASRGRRVLKDQLDQPFAILKPVMKKFPQENEILDDSGEPTGEVQRVWIQYLAGFEAWKVYGIEQTEVADKEIWSKFAGADTREFFDSLPWLAVADKWGLTVSAFDGGAGWYGFYEHGKRIGLSVAELQTWAHEMIHAAEDHNGTITKGPGQQEDNEVVAELGACVLLQLAGHEADVDLRFAWEYVNKYSRDPRKTAFLLLGRICKAVDLVLTESEALDTKTIAAQELSATEDRERRSDMEEARVMRRKSGRPSCTPVY